MCGGGGGGGGRGAWVSVGDVECYRRVKLACSYVATYSTYRGVRNNSTCKKIMRTKPLQPTHQSKAEAKTSWSNGLPSAKSQPLSRKERFSFLGCCQLFYRQQKETQFLNDFVDEKFKNSFVNSFSIHSGKTDFSLNKTSKQEKGKNKKLKR